MANLVGKVIREFLSELEESLKEEFARDKQDAANPRPLSKEEFPE